MILNEATAQEVNKILTHFIIENNHVVGIKDYNSKAIDILITAIAISMLISFIIVIIYRSSMPYSMRRNDVVGKTTTALVIILPIIICLTTFIFCYPRAESKLCIKYDKIYQESIEVVSDVTEKNTLESICINDMSDAEEIRKEPRNNKQYSCTIITENNRLKKINIPYDKAMVVMDETPYIDVTYDNVKYLNSDMEQRVKSATIHVTKDMMNSIAE